MWRTTTLALGLLLSFGALAGTLPRDGICVRVVDGDTLEVHAQGSVHRVRLVGVDTPEKHDSPKLKREAARTGKPVAEIQELGAVASKYTALAVQGQPVQLEYDPANTEAGHKDKGGRLLAYVWFRSKGKRALLNSRIILAGYGRAMTRYPYRRDRRTQFVAAEREAKKAQRGLWGKTLPELPEAEVAIVANRRSKVFHGPSCRYGKKMLDTNKLHFPNAQAAREAGFRACGACGGK